MHIVKRTGTLVAALVCAWPALSWACSGPGAMAAITRSENLGWIMAGAATLLGLGAMGLRRWSGLAWSRSWWPMVVAGIHPGWWLSARGGDCGSMRLWGSVGMLAAMLMLVLVIALMAVARKRRSQNEG